MIKHLKLGTNSKGTARLWIEGRPLIDSGWMQGSRYDIDYQPDTITLQRRSDGARKVSGTDARPIIDLCNRKIGDILGSKGTDLELVITFDTISIRKC